jgi:hypothetical protein
MQEISIPVRNITYLLVIFTHLSHNLNHSHVTDRIIFGLRGGRNNSNGLQTYPGSTRGPLIGE